MTATQSLLVVHFVLLCVAWWWTREAVLRWMSELAEWWRQR